MAEIDCAVEKVNRMQKVGVVFRKQVTIGITLVLGLSALLGASLPSRAEVAAPPSKPATSLLTLPEDKPIRGIAWPSLSPDGKTACFVYLGDLWTVPTGGGTANRLTVHEALDAYPHWSPDGRWIAFTSMRTGNPDAFLVPAEGGEARQVTFNSSSDWVTDWSPDGTKLLFYSVRDTHTFALYSIDLTTRALKRLTKDEEPLRFASWSPDGKSIAYTRSGQPWWRPWYRGSVAASTVIENLATGNVRTLIKSGTQQFWPLYAPDGKAIYVSMIYGNANTPNLWRVPVEGGEPHAVTHYTTDAVRYPAIARNGSLLAYIHNGDLYTVKPDGSGAAKLRILAHSDDKINNQERVVLNNEATESELSPDGKQLALDLRGSIWLVPTAGGDAKRLTDAGSSDNDITWSPDSTKLVMVSDRGNQTDMYTIDVKTKAIVKLTDDPDVESSPQWSPDSKWISFAKAGANSGLYLVPSAGGAPARRLAEGNGNNHFGTGITSQSWSPDSKWVAFSRMDRYENRDIWVVPAIGGAPIDVTQYPGENADPLFTKDGKRLLFASDRGGPGQVYQLPLEQEDDTPQEEGVKKPVVDRSKDVKIDFDDITQRAKAITLPIGNVDDYAPTPDSQKVIVHVVNNFWVVPIAGGQMQPLTGSGEAGGNIRFTPDGARFFYLGANGTPRSLGVAGGPVSAVAFNAEMLFDRRLQYQQAFNEFYRKFGAAFYDAKMHGVDWNAIRAKYEPLLQGVATPEEFANLLSEMVGEVNSSHSEISPASRPGGPQTATLGVFYDDSYTGPGLKVSGVMEKGPADKPSTRLTPGDYILSVDGVDVRMTEDYYQTLQDKAGKTVELLVNSKPSKDGARTIKLKPISTTDWAGLEYDARVKHDRNLVNKLSDSRLAYIHVQGMDQPSLKKFEREIWSEALGKDGLVLDIRNNGGGNTHDAILAALSRHIYGFTQPRDGLRQSQPQRAWTKPIVLLINQNSYSDAEIFPAGFRALKLGKIVGVATPGYVIGTYEGALVNGTRFRLPSWAYYTSEGKNMENLGIPPDITVENTPEDIVAGRDRQLEVAVDTLLKQLPPGGATTAGILDGQNIFGANVNPNGGSSAARSGAK